MTSKERVYASLRGEIPDCIPTGEFSVDGDTAERILGRPTPYRSKYIFQQMLWDGRRDELADMLKRDIVELYAKLDCLDIINLACHAGGMLPPESYVPEKITRIDDTTWKDESDRIYKYSPQTQDIVMVEDPHCWDLDYTREYFENLAPERADDSQFEVIDEVIRAFPDRFLISPSGADIGLILLGGFERGLTEYLTNEDGMRAAYEFYVRQENALDETRIRPGTDAVIFQNDYCFNSGCFLSPSMLREFGLNPMKERVAHARKHVPFVFKHCCGNTNDILNFFAEIGIDCYQSVQRTAGMDLFSVHRDWGDRFAVWGGIDVESYLTGSVEAVRTQTQALLDYYGDGKPRLIAGSSHSIAVGARYENFMTYLEMIQTARSKA